VKLHLLQRLLYSYSPFIFKITEQEQKRRKLFVKEKRLEAYENVKAQKLRESAAKDANNATKSNDSFFSKLAEKIVNNVQIKIRNVHARYEDVENADNKIILGITLNELSVQSCDENWMPKFISVAMERVYKVCCFALFFFCAYNFFFQSLVHFLKHRSM